MTDQSRVEAVARALAAAANWVWDGLADDVKDYWHELAQAAIEANDAWLKELNPRLAAALKLLYEESRK